MNRTEEFDDCNLFQRFREFRWENKKLVKNKKFPIILNSTLGGRDDTNSDKYKKTENSRKITLGKLEKTCLFRISYKSPQVAALRA